MDLLIVRHAIAFERDPRRWPDDGERPLSPRGVARAHQAAAGLKQLVRQPARVLVSPLIRARQTAAILTEVAGWPAARECAALAPGNSAEAVLTALKRLSEARVALVGHEPALGRLVAVSLAGTAGARAFRLKKMGAAQLTFDAGVRAGGAHLAWLAPPKLLRAAR